jgi:hypothetical protein
LASPGSATPAIAKGDNPSRAPNWWAQPPPGRRAALLSKFARVGNRQVAVLATENGGTAMASHIFRRAAQITTALLLAGLIQAAPARADFVFDLSGTCVDGSGCSGTATGVLTLADSYVFGTVMTTADFISFTYSSSSRSFQLLGADPAIRCQFRNRGWHQRRRFAFRRGMGRWVVGRRGAL